MGIIVDYIEGPACLSSALVNGDDSSFDYWGREEMEELLKSFMDSLEEGYFVVSCDGDTFFERWNGQHMEMVTYTIHKMED